MYERLLNQPESTTAPQPSKKVHISGQQKVQEQNSTSIAPDVVIEVEGT